MLKKIFTPYAILAFLLAAALPMTGFLVFIVESRAAFVRLFAGEILLLMCTVVPLAAGWIWAAKAPLPDTLFARWMPLVLPPLLPPLAYIPRALAGEPFAGGLVLGLFVVGALGLYACLYLAFLIRSERRRRSTQKMRGAACLLGLVVICAASVATVHHAAMSELMQPGEEASVGHHGVNIWEYRPFRPDKSLVEQLAYIPSLRIRSDHPRLDGAIAAFPVYAAFAQAVYAGLNVDSGRKVVDCTNTVQAYKRLADGEVDIFFGAPPSQGQRDYAAAKGLSLVETPIGREAFVFLVHKDNPVRSLTQAQVKAVYSGRVRNWKALGGPDEAILAFQRPKDSGSQTTMLRIMDGEAMIRPLRREYAEGMGDVVIMVAEYRNRANALGYSFRWYATTLFSDPDIRLLAIDGILPTPENIASDAYPFTMPLVAVTARPLSPQSRSLLDWILGHEGQSLLAQVGYVPLAADSGNALQ